VQTFDMVEFIRAAKERVKADRAKYEKAVKELHQIYTIKGFDGNDEPLMNVIAVGDQLMAIGEEHNLAGFAFREFMSVIDETGAYCSHAESHVAEHYAFGYECDIHGAISDLMLRRANFNTAPAYLAEFTIRHPENDNVALVWHGGAPLSLCHPDVKPELGHHWILPSPLSGINHYRLKDGLITVARFDGERGQYKLAFGEGKTVSGPKTLNNYVWMEVDNWPHWERTLMEGPYIHHIAMSYGHYGDALAEACKYIPGLEPERLG
jgi:L-fucose isomerase-like protein